MDRIIGVSTFASFGRSCLTACLCSIIALSAPLAVHADTVNDEAGQRFTLDGTRLIFDGAVEREEGSKGIGYEDSHELRTFLFEQPEIELLKLHSGGGAIGAALEMAAVLVDFEIDTVVTGRCDSACTLVFVAEGNYNAVRASA